MCTREHTHTHTHTHKYCRLACCVFHQRATRNTPYLSTNIKYSHTPPLCPKDTSVMQNAQAFSFAIDFLSCAICACRSCSFFMTVAGTAAAFAFDADVAAGFGATTLAAATLGATAFCTATWCAFASGSLFISQGGALRIWDPQARIEAWHVSCVCACTVQTHFHLNVSTTFEYMHMSSMVKILPGCSVVCSDRILNVVYAVSGKLNCISAHAHNTLKHETMKAVFLVWWSRGAIKLQPTLVMANSNCFSWKKTAACIDT